MDFRRKAPSGKGPRQATGETTNQYTFLVPRTKIRMATNTLMYTANSRKVVGKKHKSARDKTER